MMSNENLRSPELLKTVRGICIATKTMASSCPLADMVARSGIEKQFPQFQLRINAEGGQDFQFVVEGGDIKGMDVLNYYAPRGSFGVVSAGNDTVYVGLDTLLTDNNGREAPILIGLKGAMLQDRKTLWDLTHKLFPNLTFKITDGTLAWEDKIQLANNNVVPLLPFDLSQNLPRITLSADQPSVATTLLKDLDLDEGQKEKLGGLLSQYRKALFGSEKFAVMHGMSEFLPNFGGIKIDNDTTVFGNDPGARTWTLEEIEGLIDPK